MPKRSLGTHLSIWERLAAAVANNSKDLSLVQRDLEILQQALQEIRETKQRQIELRAAAQQATRDLEAAMETANRATVRLHAGILSAYGSKDPKITEFGLRPWRTRRRKAAPETLPTEGDASPPTAKLSKPRRRRKE